jgi:hypothetical protein
MYVSEKFIQGKGGGLSSWFDALIIRSEHADRSWLTTRILQNFRFFLSMYSD